jgi:SAM-dependent methyltransferase
MGWQSSGEAWGSRAVEWAYLFEPYSRPANLAVFDQCGVTTGTSVLDVGCGSGFALRLAADRGALVAGLDASQALLEIAGARTPEADVRLGDMDALPWGDDSFDVVTSFNSIWTGCEQAAAEAARVLRPHGTFGMTFWGSPKRLGLLPYFMAVAQNSPPSHAQATVDQGATGRPGVAEALLESAGLRVLNRGAVSVTNEFPDLETFCRAAVAAGPSVPAVAQIGEDQFKQTLMIAFADASRQGLGVRITSELGWLIATT